MLTLRIVDRRSSTISRRFQDLNELADRVVCLVHRRFELTVGLEVGFGTVMKEAVGKRSAYALVEEHEQQSELHSLVGESVGVSIAVAF